jgi:oxygen-dependent protoporphyrinogen oxidase
MKTKTVILGAGISGLSTAQFLQQKGADFLLLEASNRVGGNIHSEEIDGFVCENGPNTVLLNNTAIVQLIKEVGLWEEICKPQAAAHNRFVLHKGRLQEIPDSPLSFLRTPLLSFTDKLRLLKEPFITKHSENTSIANFARKRFGTAFYEQFVLPFVTGIYAGNPEQISVQHALKILWELEQKHGSVFKGFIQKQKKQFEEELPKIKMFTLPKGLGQLTNVIAKNIGDKLHLNSLVTTIEKTAEGYQIQAGEQTIYCEEIICTLPAHSTAKLVDDSNLQKQLLGVEYVPVDVLHIGFNKTQVKNQKPGFGVLSKPSDKKHFLGLLFNSRIFPHTAPEGKELFTVIVGGSRQPELCSMEKKVVQQILLEEMKGVLAIEGSPCFIQYQRYTKAIPQYDMQQAELISSILKFNKKQPYFHLIGNYTGGISVSDCVLKAQQLANNL